MHSIHLLVRGHDAFRSVCSLNEQVLGGRVGLCLLADGPLLHFSVPPTEDGPGHNHHTCVGREGMSRGEELKRGRKGEEAELEHMKKSTTQLRYRIVLQHV